MEGGGTKVEVIRDRVRRCLQGFKLHFCPPGRPNSEGEQRARSITTFAFRLQVYFGEVLWLGKSELINFFISFRFFLIGKDFTMPILYRPPKNAIRFICGSGDGHSVDGSVDVGVLFQIVCDNMIMTTATTMSSRTINIQQMHVVPPFWCCDAFWRFSFPLDISAAASVVRVLIVVIMWRWAWICR
jgi:hypothetical protein